MTGTSGVLAIGDYSTGSFDLGKFGGGVAFFCAVRVRRSLVGI